MCQDALTVCLWKLQILTDSFQISLIHHINLFKYFLLHLTLIVSWLCSCMTVNWSNLRRCITHDTPSSLRVGTFAQSWTGFILFVLSCVWIVCVLVFIEPFFNMVSTFLSIHLLLTERLSILLFRFLDYILFNNIIRLLLLLNSSSWSVMPIFRNVPSMFEILSW